MPLDNDFWDEEDDELLAAVMALYIATLMQGVTGGVDVLPPELQSLVDIDLINGGTLEQSASFRDAILSGIQSTTRQQVEAVLDEWERTGGGDISQLEAMLEPIFSENRADAIAITETTKAFQDGNTLAWGAVGMYVTHMQWHTQKDERVCPICAPKDDMVISIKSGDRPPAHPRCRCFTTPISNL